ncbi:methenyltetrahydromethanopterin cyclohydrolase [Thiocapsa rosea]|uniref:Methenyltetrahydromethanopterin cyclohydrolase n=1 Tax=Thiocapsa rosea TaxID=69360 RepID=A0A495VCN1_9GAMM|nr:methenyltetrahydromethanopterin cyclohydrolase [Thiocapsa rosea]RKT47112.1 methenyltetrahydromethanopterin cyclohydrolase [Thiocapsa rosea]
MNPDQPSINRLSAPLVDDLVADADRLRLLVHRLDNGCRLIDAGTSAAGGLEAGRRIAEICLGGLGQVGLRTGGAPGGWAIGVEVITTNPVLACLGSQYAGWSLSHGEGKGSFHALGSGPGRSLALKEPLFAELGYRDRAEQTSLVLEVDRIPPEPLVEKIARDCGIEPSGLTLILTPTRTLAGTVQIVARVLEVALHKAHALGFDLAAIRDGMGSAPLPPPAPDFVTAMGRTNDAILFAGQVHLFVTGADDAAEDLAMRLPSSASRDYGRPFAEIFAAYGHDFFKIDPLLFSPARILVTALDSGRTFAAGGIDANLLAASFGLAP